MVLIQRAYAKMLSKRHLASSVCLEKSERERNSVSHELNKTKQSSNLINMDNDYSNRRGGNNRETRVINNTGQHHTSSNNHHQIQIRGSQQKGPPVITATVNELNSNRARKDNSSYFKSRQPIILDSKSSFERQSSVKSGSRMVGAHSPALAGGDHSLGYSDAGGEQWPELEQKYLVCKLKQYIFVYNECANRHWLWNQMPYQQVRFMLLARLELDSAAV